MGRVICFYHRADLDGVCSAAIVHKAHPDAILLGVDYGDDFDEAITGAEITKEDTVFVVDFTFTQDGDFHWMVDLRGACKELIWVDHHKSAVDMAVLIGEEFNGVRRVGTAGCELTWEWLFAGSRTPPSVTRLGRYDVFDTSDQANWDRFILPFQYGVRSIPGIYDPYDCTWPPVLRSREDFAFGIINTGKGILAYENQRLENACNKGARTGILTLTGGDGEADEVKFIHMNTTDFRSQAFESVYNEKDHTFMLAWAWEGDHWRFGAYTTHDDVDCSKIAKKYGGGGHQKAAGWQSRTLPKFLRDTMSYAQNDKET